MILLVGKSGSGKTTTAKYLEQEYGMKQVQSYTTRKPRYKGEDGHIFVTDSEYRHIPDKVATTRFNNYDYCATQQQCDNADIYVIDPHGIESFNRNYHGNKKWFMVYLDVNPFTRFIRMVKRGDGIFAALKRLRHDRDSFKDFTRRSDIILVKNKDVKEASKIIYSLCILKKINMVDLIKG